nr:MAG TPA: hypothetical protein [Caudoviricetes sp.]
MKSFSIAKKLESRIFQLYIIKLVILKEYLFSG